MTGLKKSPDTPRTAFRMGNISVKSLNGTVDILAITVVKSYPCNLKFATTGALINDVSGVVVKNTGNSTNHKNHHPALSGTDDRTYKLKLTARDPLSAKDLADRAVNGEETPKKTPRQPPIPCYNPTHQPPRVPTNDTHESVYNWAIKRKRTTGKNHRPEGHHCQTWRQRNIRQTKLPNKQKRAYNVVRLPWSW